MSLRHIAASTPPSGRPARKAAGTGSSAAAQGAPDAGSDPAASDAVGQDADGLGDPDTDAEALDDDALAEEDLDNDDLDNDDLDDDLDDDALDDDDLDEDEVEVRAEDVPVDNDGTESDPDTDLDAGVAAVAPRRRRPRVRLPRGSVAVADAAPVSTRTGPRVNTGPAIRPKSGLDAYFEVSQRRSTYGREVRGGFVTFFTMAYILVLNPIILTSGPDVDGTTLPFGAVAATTAMVAAVMTILMGIVGRYPFALATGLGLNALVAVLAFSQLSWPEIMGLVVLEGLLIAILVVTGLRTAIFFAIPQQLKIAISVG
ncbi:MAG: hypothetical protein ACR2JG_12320, partial [Geodermatophilaceae bacterium]